MATTALPPSAEQLSRTRDRGFLGHPKGLAYLAFTEAWERFSYYGMTALVVLYMVQQLLLPGHVEHVAGMAAYRSALEAVFGPMSPQALASQTFGFYTGLVYFTPLFGGWIGDRLLGVKRTVIIGALLMSAGHFAMAFDQSFLIALLLLILGSGCLKGNIAAQVGHLYAPDDVSRRTRAFTIFSTGINVGATTGPLVCGLLAQLYGWHIGFGCAGVLMLLATITYLAGQRHLPDQRPRKRDRAPTAPLSKSERRTVVLLVLAASITIFQSVAYYQVYNVGLVWIDAHVNLATPIGHIPVPWFNSIDPFVSIVAVPPLIYLWILQQRRGSEPSDVAKIGIGAAIASASSGLIVLGILLAGNGKVGAIYPVLACVGMGIAFLYYWPPLLALISRTAPPSINATMVSGAYLALFVGNVLMGWVGSYYEKMSPAAFWTMNALIGATGALLVLLFGRRLGRAIEHC
jgi:proton-dependent oligopeptide transporter, POT family